MNRIMTTILDAIGLLLLASGLASALYVYMGWSCLAVAGAVVLGGSWLAAREHKHKDESA